MRLPEAWEPVGLVRPELVRQTALIGGEWVSSDRKLTVTDPATGACLGSVPDLGSEATLQAVAAASATFPAWRQHSAPERAAILHRWHDLIQAHTEDLARIMTSEQGKPLGEARGEVAYAASFIKWFAEEARRTYGDVIPGHARDKRLVVMREPVGVVAAITPWNFPLAMITRKVGPALAAGCTVIVKPSDLTPFSALALAFLAREAGLPDGVLNVVTGTAAPIGDVLVSHPDIAKISFTGSTGVGTMLATRAMASVKRVSLELGGNAPFIVFDDADLGEALNGAVASKFRNAGQTCVCANRFFVQAGIYDRFVDGLAERIDAIRVGAGLIEGVDLGPLINEAAIAKSSGHVADALHKGGTLVTGGRAIDGAGHFFKPTLIRDVTPDALLCREETFGPVAGIVRFDTEAQAITMANDTTAGLAAYLFTRDLSRSHRVTEALQCGMIGLNTGLISSEVAPFGGVKQSGFGREGSRYGMDEYLNLKLVCTSVAPI
ncbi:NAD-dependent succinate-semialdehyde dehydrogenase [Altererythrobacter sp. B11]|uniref:NAD-dependent succinate-semialdehyde dehydrogenase n=1 Tax=Altererythrobacter sp. B11 TaxID=2060312 RepID=UPI000DC6F192|nr:NAD-dependent succinate-semialdehyde dehydrogenase [Altererythrobacter sp. B11]BBC73993.1 NAD-dependent succinate-semialdehyde dehydrogenase [Altererythrobacter sp. B11]